ncbi:MAG: DUF456 domain-containing protein [Anaerolineae bacterium]|nr:DUF456 domain-containing protein [Anaerolineae bacterium]
MSGTANTLALIVVFVLMTVGVLGTVLPVIPGTILIFVAALIYAVVEGFQVIGWPTLVVMGLLTAVATTADIWASSVGARIGGASGWSVLFGLAGGVAGLVFFSLPGAVIGAVLGVLLTEMMRVRDWRKALRAGGGWLVGWLLSTVVQLAAGLVMVVIFIWQLKQGP